MDGLFDEASNTEIAGVLIVRLEPMGKIVDFVIRGELMICPPPSESLLIHQPCSPHLTSVE